MHHNKHPVVSKPLGRLSFHSLAWKLTLAFLLVGLMGATLVAVLVGQRTRSEFDRFLSDHDQAILLNALSSYYAATGRWDGVAVALRNPPLSFYSQRVAIVDQAGTVVLPNQGFVLGQVVPAQVVLGGRPIEVNGRTVGSILFVAAASRPSGPPGPLAPDAAFLQRVAWAAAISAVIAAVIALLLGGVLARNLTRPVRELTAATKAMAAGQLEQQVTVRSHDEIGELATSFNQMSADLVRASQLRKQMTADLAHDLRTPLSILRGYTEGLKDSRLQGTPALFTIMHDEVIHLQRLVEDLRLLSLADAGELPLNRRNIDPMALLERTGLAYIMEAEQHGIALRVEPHGVLPSINVDTDRLTQVLNNLVSNALRYTAHGEIALSATADQQWVRLQVRDTGSGIPAEDLPFIFDRFYRADKARQRGDTTASGLGLAIAKAIVEAHGGTLTVRSTVDVGTVFTIALPVASKPVVDDQAHHPSVASR